MVEFILICAGVVGFMWPILSLFLYKNDLTLDIKLRWIDEKHNNPHAHQGIDLPEYNKVLFDPFIWSYIPLKEYARKKGLDKKCV